MLIKDALTGHALDDDGNELCYQLAGRLIARRKVREITFFELRDRSGSIGLAVGDANSDFAAWFAEWDIGDIVAVVGTTFDSKGQIGLRVSAGQILTKALQLNHGLTQQENRPSRRELRLMSSPTQRRQLRARSQLVAAIRQWLRNEDFIEVETPLLQPFVGGALARPFSTFHNALARELTLRISTQLYLRRCLAGDIERVFELGRCFRNEGMSAKHSPEFTMLEWSMAYSDYRDTAHMAEAMIADVVEQVLSQTPVERDGERITFARPWRWVSLREAIKEHTGLDILRAGPERLLAAAGIHQLPARDLATRPANAWAEAVDLLYAKRVEGQLIQPTVIYDFPFGVHPCMRRCSQGDPRLGEGFDIVIGGVEIASGGSELTDPDEQQRRFDDQRSGTAVGSDNEYVSTLTYGVPPSSGTGIGIDRLLMILSGERSIGEATLFSSTG